MKLRLNFSFVAISGCMTDSFKQAKRIPIGHHIRIFLPRHAQAIARLEATTFLSTIRSLPHSLLYSICHKIIEGFEYRVSNCFLTTYDLSP